MSSYVFAPARTVSLPVHGVAQRFPVNRVFCVAQNYAQHAVEMGSSGREDPFFFMKPASSVVPVAAGTVQPVPYPSGTQSLHHEVELVVALGRCGSNVDPARAEELIYGYAVGLDLTRRDLQTALKAKGRPWEVAKGFEASGPVGPIMPREQVGTLVHGGIRLSVDGEERQSGDLDQMIWNVNEIISHLSRHWSLVAGDIVFTGTPAGVGAVVRGNHLQGSIDGLDGIQVELV